VDFLELVFAIVIAGIAVRMQRLGELAVGALDGFRRGTAVHSQHFVVTTLIHMPLTAINDGSLPPSGRKRAAHHHSTRASVSRPPAKTSALAHVTPRPSSCSRRLR